MKHFLIGLCVGATLAYTGVIAGMELGYQDKTWADQTLTTTSPVPTATHSGTTR